MKSSASKPPILNRYTSLPVALDVLSKRRITLLTPETWEDENDAYYLERYRTEMKLRSLLAICFSSRRETFHQWRIFSQGIAGVCLEFDKEKLLTSFSDKKVFRHEKVVYKWVSEVSEDKPELSTWPFLKRKPFEDEGEYRIIFESATESHRATRVPIKLNAVRKVTLSPWLSEPVAKSVSELINGIDGCDEITVNKSSLIDNAGWRDAIK